MSIGEGGVQRKIKKTVIRETPFLQKQKFIPIYFLNLLTLGNRRLMHFDPAQWSKRLQGAHYIKEAYHFHSIPQLDNLILVAKPYRF